MATRLRRAILHINDPYAEGNDDQGLAAAAVRGLWIDRDLQRDIRGVFIGTHWGRPSREGFRLRGRRVTGYFRMMPYSRIAKLRTRDGHRIQTAGHAIREAKRLGVPGIEFELKFVPTLRALKRLAKVAAEEYGANWEARIQIKMLSGFRWRLALWRAKRAGFVTTLIRFGGDPARLPKYVDHYRR